MADPTSYDTRIVLTEQFDVEMMAILAKHDGVPQDIKKHLKAYRKKAINGNRVQVLYTYGDTLKSLKSGRLYADKSLGLQSLRSDIRAALATKYYWDVDMVNAQPNILVGLCKKHGWTCEKLEDYTKYRSYKLAELSQELNCDRTMAKDFCLSILFGSQRGLAINEYFRDLTIELAKIAENCVGKYPEIVQAVLNSKKFKKDPTNLNAKVLAHVAQVEESKLLEFFTDCFTQAGRAVGTLVFDGCLIEKQEGEIEFPSTLLRQVEEQVLNHFGYKVFFEVKPLVNTFSGNEESKVNIVPPSVLINDLYAAKRFVELCGDRLRKVGPDVFCLRDDGHWSREKSDLKGMVFSFYKQLVFHQVNAVGTLVPHDYGGNNKNVNALLENVWFCAPEGDLPIQFAYSFTEEGSSEALALFQELIELASKGREATKDYLIKYLAHMIQHPLDLPGVCLIVTGPKGCGKDTMFDFLIEHVLGALYSHNYNTTKQVFEKHDIGRMFKFLVKLEEADRAVCLQNASELKSFITSKSSMFNPKGKTQVTVPNYCRMVFTTNKGNPVDFTEGERRFVLYDYSPEKKGNLDYWKKVREVLFTPEGGRAVADWLLSIDLSGFNVRQLPENEYQEFIVEAEETVETKFINQLVTEDWVKMKDLYASYVTFCTENSYIYCSNAKALGVRLMPFVRDGGLQTRRNKEGVRYKKV